MRNEIIKRLDQLKKELILCRTEITKISTTFNELEKIKFKWKILQ